VSGIDTEILGDAETAAIAAELLPPRIAESTDGDPPGAAAS